MQGIEFGDDKVGAEGGVDRGWCGSGSGVRGGLVGEGVGGSVGYRAGCREAGVVGVCGGGRGVGVGNGDGGFFGVVGCSEMEEME